MIEIVKRTLQKNLIYNGKIILKYKIEYPQILNKNIFNIYYYAKAKELQRKCETELWEEAKDLYEYNKKNGYPIMTFEILLNYYIAYNYNKVISLYNDEYIYSGGAHGNTTRTSQTWNIINEKLIKLEDLYPNDDNYVSTILKNINNQIANNIKKGNNYYFEKYCCLTAENFRVQNFYLNYNYIVIYYQQYDIGPYSSGIIQFYMKFNNKNN